MIRVKTGLACAALGLQAVVAQAQNSISLDEAVRYFQGLTNANPATRVAQSLKLYDANGTNALAPFTTDGCSLFPNGTIEDTDRWLDCCVEHDIAYWKGGTEQERLEADIRLRECILQKTGDGNLAKFIYDSVRTWGGPVFPNWYRWAYGWPYGREYEPLTDDDLKQVRDRMRQYEARR